MINLVKFDTSAFGDCVINEFDAPNLNSISIDKDKYSCLKITFSVGKKNFQDSPGILQKVDCPNEEPDYEQLIQKLPKECFECTSANLDNYKLFIIDNAVVFPDNILSVEDRAFF